MTMTYHFLLVSLILTCVGAIDCKDMADQKRDWIYITSSQDGKKLAVTEHGGWVWTSSDGGYDWTNEGSFGLDILASSSDGSTVIATPYQTPNSNKESQGPLYLSTDSGDNWKGSKSSGESYWRSVASSGDGTILIAVAQTKYFTTTTLLSSVKVSTDAGLSWFKPENLENKLGTSAVLSVAASTDGTRLFAASLNRFWRSTDKGSTWQSFDFTIGTDGAVSIASSSDGSKLAASRSGGPIFLSENAGTTWIESTSGTRDWSQVTCSSDGTKLAATTFTDGIWYSFDSGETWENAEITSTEVFEKKEHKEFNGVTMDSDGTKLSATENEGYLWFSSDGGATWDTCPYSKSSKIPSWVWIVVGVVVVLGACIGFVHTRWLWRERDRRDKEFHEKMGTTYTEKPQQAVCFCWLPQNAPKKTNLELPPKPQLQPLPMQQQQQQQRQAQMTAQIQLQPTATAPPPSLPPLPPPAPMAITWHPAVDPASGRTYYVNSFTKETSWTDPSTDPSPPPPLLP